jgi:signal peptidase I
MFSNCLSVKRIYISDEWKIKSGENMFHNCSKIMGEYGTRLDKNKTSEIRAILDKAPEKPGYFTDYRRLNEKWERKEIVQVVSAEKDKKEKPAKEKFYKRLFKLFRRILLICLIVFLVKHFVATLRVIHDTNMYPKVSDGDIVFLYKLDNFYQGDMVLYKFEDKEYLGRIIAKAGDTIDIKEGSYTINGGIPYEDVFYQTIPSETKPITLPYTVPEGTFFIMNDNRNNTVDSREMGAISEEDIIGKTVILWRHRGF